MRCPAMARAMTSRMSAPPPSGLISRTVPRAVMMPVNIQAFLGELAQHVVAEPNGANVGEARHRVQSLDAEGLHGGPAIPAHDRRRMEPGDAVHQVGAQQRRGELARRLPPAAG